MPHIFIGICKGCGHKSQFQLDFKPGPIALRCNTCGKEKNVDSQLAMGGVWEPDRPGCTFREAERVAGSCGCGGVYVSKSVPRCPKCKSDDIQDTREFTVYG